MRISQCVEGKTDLFERGIEVGNAVPIAQCQYRLPERVKDAVKEELDGLLEVRVIEHSNSP